MKLSDVSMYTVLHELGHVIGLEHEHNRMDRDDYIKVFFGNIEDEDKDQFMIDYSRLYNNTKLPYDYESIMHYSNKTCSKNGKDTLRSLLNPDEELGGDSLTPLDIQRVNLIY
jgi:NADH:ubiquinone oxidoreductase subunit